MRFGNTIIDACHSIIYPCELITHLFSEKPHILFGFRCHAKQHRQVLVDASFELCMMLFMLFDAFYWIIHCLSLFLQQLQYFIKYFGMRHLRCFNAIKAFTMTFQCLLYLVEALSHIASFDLK